MGSTGVAGCKAGGTSSTQRDAAEPQTEARATSPRHCCARLPWPGAAVGAPPSAAYRNRITNGWGRKGSDSSASLAHVAMVSRLVTSGSNATRRAGGRTVRSTSRPVTPGTSGSVSTTRVMQPAQVNRAAVSTATFSSAKATNSWGDRSTGCRAATTSAPGPPRSIASTTGGSV